MDLDTYSLIVSAIGSLGFPIVIAFYVLVRVDKTMRTLIDRVSQLTEALYRTRLDPPRG